MGCDIHIVAQRCDAGEWRDVEGKFSEGPAPFDWRSYGMFGFLGYDGRNYSEVPALAPLRGLPEDVGDTEDGWKFGDHSYSWLSVSELASFDYAKQFEDRRVTREVSPGNFHGGCTADPGEGKVTTFREFLGEQFIADVAELQRIGADRVVFGFDN
jgi:hypothetical protein